MTTDNELIYENDSDAWWHQLDVEAHQAQQREREITPEVREVIEILDRSAAMLANIPEINYPVIADLRRRLQIERTFLKRKHDISLNELVKAARKLLIK
tara:strand:- start:331 stop:627 length:297 start_codon:yes stop_codon:yes gene_type:complete